MRTTTTTTDEMGTDGLPASRKAAQQQGTRYYYTGKPCRHGHDAPRLTADGRCTTCVRHTSAKRNQDEVVQQQKAEYELDHRNESTRKRNLSMVADGHEFAESTLGRSVLALLDEDEAPDGSGKGLGFSELAYAYGFLGTEKLQPFEFVIGCLREAGIIYRQRGSNRLRISPEWSAHRSE